MLKWTKGQTKRLAKGYSVTAYTAEGVPAIIEKRRITSGTISTEDFTAIYKGQMCGNFPTLSTAKKCVEWNMKIEWVPATEGEDG